MKVLLFLFTVWSSIYINYSLRRVEYDVGSIPVNWAPQLWIYCRGPCEIEDVKATLGEGGDMKLIGFYGDRENSKFCEGIRNNGKVIAKCELLKNTRFSKARIKINAIKECHNVSLTVRGKNLYKIHDLPPSKYEFEYDIGSIQANKESWFWINCRGHCEIEEVDATLSNGGGVNLKGFYGEGANYRFCNGTNKAGTGIAKCEMSKKTGLLQARIKIDAYKESRNVTLIVRGYNLYEILNTPPYNYEFVYDVGSVHVYLPQRVWIHCRGPCIIEDVKVTFSLGNMTLFGLHGDGENSIFCEGQKSSFHKDIHQYKKICQISDNFGLEKALIKINALTECRFVHLRVKGINVLGIGDDHLEEVKYDIGTIGINGHPNQYRYYIQCSGRYCEIEDVDVIHYSGFMTLSGLHGDGENSKFCEGQPRILSHVNKLYIKKCRVLKKYWLEKAVIKIESLSECLDVSLTVRGRNVKSISIIPIQEVYYDVRFIPMNVAQKLWIYCRGPCKIEDVEADLREEGDVNLIGYYGEGEYSKFCEGPRKIGAGIAKCNMLIKKGLSKAKIYINANKESHKVHLRVKGYNLFKISRIPPLQYEVSYNVGSISVYGFPSFWISCRGPCEIEEVEATLSKNGDVALYGIYGNSGTEKFCQSAPNDGTGIEKCSMLKRRGLARARVNILCWENCNNVNLKVRGYNLIEILDEPPSPKNITINVGTLNKNQYKNFTIQCKAGGCIFVHISVTFKTGGDVRTMGSIQNGVDSDYRNIATLENPHHAAHIPMTCPRMIYDAGITLHGHKKSEEVTLTVIGPYLESVDLKTA